MSGCPLQLTTSFRSHQGGVGKGLLLLSKPKGGKLLIAIQTSMLQALLVCSTALASWGSEQQRRASSADKEVTCKCQAGEGRKEGRGRHFEFIKPNCMFLGIYAHS